MAHSQTSQSSFASPGSSDDPMGVGAPAADKLGLLVGLNLFCLLVSAIRSQHKWFQWLPDHALNLIGGLIFGGLAHVVGVPGLGASLSDNFSGLFFEFFLPPIIFSSAYSLKRRDFFRNIGAILTLSVVGTVFSTFVIGWCIYKTLSLGWAAVPGADFFESSSVSLLHCLIIGAVLSAVDPVAVVAVLKCEFVDKQLLALLFGESVLNDAVAIVLYSGLCLLHSSGVSDEFTLATAGRLLGRFCAVSIGSFALGATVGLMSSLVVRYAGHRHSPAKEQALLLLFAYLSYLLARISALSPVLCLFVTGITMSHYTYYNLSKASQIATVSGFRCIAYIMETFVFVFLGVSATTMGRNEWSTSLSVVFIGACLVARVTVVVTLCGVVNLSRCLMRMCNDRKFISVRSQCVLLWSGLRGSVAFALALHAPVFNHRGVLVSSCMFVVLFSYLVQGSTVRWLVHYLGLERHDAGYDILFRAEEHDTRTPCSERHNDKEEEEGVGSIDGNGCDGRPKETSRLQKIWRILDEEYMKPVFGGRPRDSRSKEEQRVIIGRSPLETAAYDDGDADCSWESADQMATGLMSEVFNQHPRNSATHPRISASSYGTCPRGTGSFSSHATL